MYSFTNDLPDLSGKSILITGGTGSFGKALTRVLLDNFKPRRIIHYARQEHAHFHFNAGLTEEERGIMRSFIGDVRDLQRLTLAFRDVDVVIHAAALKHVPLAEYNPTECANTNIGGAQNVVHAAIDCGVGEVIALSTDKAVDPVNLYGATKLASDKIFVAANSVAGRNGTKFSVVRYGNVVGSQGSVVPFFQKLLSEGARELPITDTRMTRFWITLEQAVFFTLSCLTWMRGGEIFVPKIPSMTITDLAHAMAPGLPHQIVGIRPGEKLHESMITRYNARTTCDLGDRYAIEPEWDFAGRKPYVDDGFPRVDQDFQYRSDLNVDWLKPEDMMRIISPERAEAA